MNQTAIVTRTVVTGACLIPLLCLPGRAVAADIDEVLEADANGRVTVSIISGSIEVEGWEREEVRVTGSYEDDVEEFIFDRDGREITIRIKAPDRGWGRQDVSAYLVIRVPHDNSLDIATVSSDIEVAAVRGEQELQSVSGNIVTTAYGSDIDAETVSGDVEVEAANGGGSAEWSLSSVSGDITGRGLAGDMRSEVVSGDIEIEGGTFVRVAAESVNGDITFVGGLADDARMNMETVNGAIDVMFEGPLSADFDIETFNGNIRNCFGPKPERTSKYAPGLELGFTEGDGGARVSLSTLNGSLEICKR